MKKTQIEVEQGIIDLGIGQPSLDLLPLGLMREAVLHSFDKSDPSFLQYGPDEGSGVLRLALAAFFSTHYGKQIRSDSLFITNGISQALDLVCTVLTAPGDTILVEEPTYFFVFDIFKNHGLRIESVPVEKDGMNMQILEEKVKLYKPALVYTIPTFHNPSSVTMSEGKRKMMIGLSHAYSFTIACDDAYQFLDFRSAPPLPISFREAGVCLLSLGSFSKILAPGLRLGWIHASPTVVQLLACAGFVASGGGLNPFAGDIAASAIELGLLSKHIAFLKDNYTSRLDALCAALASLIPPYVTFIKPEGGFFVWVRFPEHVDTESFLAHAKNHGVSFRPGCIFSSESGLRNFLRLSFSYYNEESLTEGVRRLARAYKEFSELNR